MSMPADVAAYYRDAGHWRGGNLSAWLLEAGERTPERTAVVDRERRLTYRQLSTQVTVLANRFRAAGFRHGDNVVLQLPNTSEFVVVTLALITAGIRPVLALPAQREREIAHVCETAEATGLIVSTATRQYDYPAMALRCLALVDSLRTVLVSAGVDDTGPDLAGLPAHTEADPLLRSPVQPEPGETALFLLSGGTTGLPKLIPRSHEDYAYNVRISAEICEFDSDTVYLVTLPAAHNFPLACPGVFGTLAVGGRAVMAATPEAALTLIPAEQVTVTAAVPGVALAWARAAESGRADLTSLALLQIGGAKLSPEPARRIGQALNVRVQQVYGMAEGLLNFTRLDDSPDVVLNTQGRPASPDDEVLIVDESGREVDEGSLGELLVRGPYTIRGYYRAPEHNARSFTPDGYYRSGDVARWHPSGNLVVEGRVKDFINRDGEKISAAEVEDFVAQYDGVEECAAVSAPDERLGERICLYVRPSNGHVVELGELRRFLVARGLAPYKLPERMVLVETLPTTAVGKIDKAALRRDNAARFE